MMTSGCSLTKSWILGLWVAWILLAVALSVSFEKSIFFMSCVLSLSCLAEPWWANGEPPMRLSIPSMTGSCQLRQQYWQKKVVESKRRKVMSPPLYVHVKNRSIPKVKPQADYSGTPAILIPVQKEKQKGKIKSQRLVSTYRTNWVRSTHSVNFLSKGN